MQNILKQDYFCEEYWHHKMKQEPTFVKHFSKNYCINIAAKNIKFNRN